MSVLTPKRVLFPAVAALLLVAASARASHPSPRNHSRMVYDEQAGHSILFGGHSPVEDATGLTYDSNETWSWTGTRWVQRFPAHSPLGRSGHAMVYDSKRGRIVLFGGRREKQSLEENAAITFLNDTWVWQNGDWTELAPANAPTPRYFSGMTYDRARDRVILFGGNGSSATAELGDPVHDTWEFDGTNWERVGGSDPQVAKPLLQYDELRNQTVMLGLGATNAETLFYVYDNDAHTWTRRTASDTVKLPPCVNEGAMVYQRLRQKVQYLGGVCSLETPGSEEVYEWNGTTWTKVETKGSASRATGQALAFDQRTNETVMFGGQIIFSNLRSLTYTLGGNRADWDFVFSAVRPAPRSQAIFRTDPESGTIWMYGGLDEHGSAYMEDFWGYKNGQWFQPPVSDQSPSNCGAPYAAFDTDRGKLVVSCVGLDTYEFTPNAETQWKFFSELKDPPPIRRFANMVYDANLKKVVLFGGFDDDTDRFRNDTWTWDGTKWTEVKPGKDRRPEERALMNMWYDPILKKTVIYSGLGRPNLDSRITRFSDMWAFDGTGWTKLTPTTTPGERFGAQVTYVPSTNKILLFGGLHVEKEGEESKRQYFANDTWEWDGTTWTKIETPTTPPGRQNGGLALDPSTQKIVLWGGHAGFYFSDMWEWDPVGRTWTPRAESFAGRRRASGH